MPIANPARSRPRVRGRAWAPLVLLLGAMTSGCGDSYEPTQTIEGVFEPTVTAPDGSHCVQIEGRGDGWLSFPTVQPIICKSIPVTEIGIMTYGWEVAQPGLKLEVARIEFSDGSVFIATHHLRNTGRLAYNYRASTPRDWARNNRFKAFLLALVGLIVVATVFGQARASASKRKRERDNAAADAAAQASARAAALAQAEAEAAARAVARAAALATLSRLAADAHGAADTLPILLGEAELTLDRAQAELKSQLPSPFWEAMEDTLGALRAFQHALSIIEERRVEYRAQSERLEGQVPAFALRVTALPDPAATQSRLNSLYREAQAIPHFSIVYEQRRTTATLIAGFRSLGQAIERLGDRIGAELGSLAASLNCRLASLESTLESSAAAAAEEGAALRAQLQSAADASEAFRGQLRRDAEGRAETERVALRMLDNIQRGRKPRLLDRP